jgi:hypothetical protein
MRAKLLATALSIASVNIASAPTAGAVPLAPLSWSAPAFVDHQPPYGGSAPRAGRTIMSALSCPTASLCVAGDARGNIVTSADPAAGASSWRIGTTRASVPALGVGIAGISCPSTSLCVAVDGGGDVLTSTSPAAGASSWKLTKVETGGTPTPAFSGSALSAVSCPSTSLCVAADHRGNVLTSTDPAAGRWKTAGVDTSSPGFFGIVSVSCPTRAFCAAVDSTGNVLTSTNPTGGASAWKLRNVDGKLGLFGISCQSASLCVAVDNNAAITSTRPAGGSSSWHRVVIDSGTVNKLNAVSCPSASLCVAVDADGNVLASTDPTGDAPGWKPTSVVYGSPFAPGIPGVSGLTAISCPSTTFCASVDSMGELARSTDPAGGSTAWPVEQIDGSNSAAGISCPSSWCVAVDQAGNVLTSTRPSDPSAWTVQAVDASGVITTAVGAVSCPSTAFCAAVHGNDRVLTSSAPLNGSSWAAATIDPGHSLASLSCASPRLCVAVDDAGNAVTSTDPGAGPSAWVVTQIDTNVTSTGGQPTLDDVSCPSVSLCVAVDSAGDVLTSDNPSGGQAAWTATALNGAPSLSAVACPSVALCVAGGGSKLFVSTTPTAGVQTWSGSDFPYALQRISCPAESLCLAGDQSGDVISSNDPGGGGSTWSTQHVQAFSILATCASSSRCFALDGSGDEYLGVEPTLRQLLGPRLRGAAGARPLAHPLGSVLRPGGYSFAFTAPIPGRLVVTWRRRGTRATIAVAGAVFADAGRQAVKVTLTPAGRRLLRHAKQVWLNATAGYTAGGSPQVSVSRTLRLTR